MTTRRERKEQRVRTHWTRRAMRAGGQLSVKAHIEWDLLRATIKGLPTAEQATAWQVTLRTLEKVREEITAPPPELPDHRSQSQRHP